jgi:hypothetical protein
MTRKFPAHKPHENPKNQTRQNNSNSIVDARATAIDIMLFVTLSLSTTLSLSCVTMPQRFVAEKK